MQFRLGAASTCANENCCDSILWSEMVKQLAQLCADVLERGRVVAPIGPACCDRKNGGVQDGELCQVLQHVRVFVVLNAVADGLQTDARSGFTRADRSRRINEYAVAWSAQSAAAGGGVHIVPTANRVASGPTIGAIVKKTCRTLGEVEEARLDAFVDRRVVHHPFRGIAEAGAAA